MLPFNYPVEPHQRRHGPQGYGSPESYRPWLRDEFAFRCVYCLDRELWQNSVGKFTVEQHSPELYRELMGYPVDLPDLSSLRPPAGNSRPEGIAQSHAARRERGELPDIY